MLKRHINFTSSAKVHPRDLDREIATAMGWKRHAGIEDKNCFCGINIVSDKGVKALQVVWTNDGENGYVKKLTPQEEREIRVVLNAHGGNINAEIR